MNTHRQKTQSGRKFGPLARHRRTVNRSQRRGSSLMIVMVLMGMLALLGVIFYTFAAQERSNAAYYSDAAKSIGNPSLTADALFDWALEQIIVGTDPRLTNSMLWGSRYSMLSNSLGVGYHRPGDLHPFNGEGVNLIYDLTGTPGTNPNFGNVAVDQNRNGLPDDGVTTSTIGSPPVTVTEPDNRFLLDYNDSPAAPKQFDSGERQLVNGTRYFPQPDVGFTYPDINSIFLTYVGKVRDNNGAVHQVVKPAYLVPGLLRSPIGGVSAPLTFEDLNLNGIPDPGEDVNNNGHLDDWMLNPQMASRVMRPHPNHIYVPSSGIPASPVNRFLNDTQAVAAIGASAHGFPWHPMRSDYDTTLGGSGVHYQTFGGQMGPYSGINTFAGPTDAPIEFDYDNDGDGINESILMDLDFPPQQDANGNLFVPLFLITIHDLDALINLNVHGNLAQLLAGPNDVSPPGGAYTQVTTPLSNTVNSLPYGYNFPVGPAPPPPLPSPQFNFLSQSNLGLSPSEVNPLWVLNARPGIQLAPPNPVNPNVDVQYGSQLFVGTSQHASFYGRNPMGTIAGDPNLTNYVGTDAAFPAGVPAWAETANMELTWAKIGRLNYTGGVITDLLPGVYGEEYLLYNANQNSTLAAAGGHSLPRPGSSLLDDNGDLNEGQLDYAPYYQHPLDYTGQGTYLKPGSPKKINWSTAVGQNQWITYSSYGNNSLVATSSNILWGQFPNLPLATPQLLSNAITQGLGDDPNEVSFYTPLSAIDHVFTPDEILYLNLKNSEIDRLNITSRLSSLIPFNFAKISTDNVRGDPIRRKFTTESNDRKSFGLPSSLRALGTGALTGPPPSTAVGIGTETNVSTLIQAGYQGQEYSLDTTTSTYKFPPQFGPLGTQIPRYQTMANQVVAAPPIEEDPFRPVTRTLLEIELNSQQSRNRLQRKLSINQYLSGDATVNPLFRDLTPHPTDPGATAIELTTGYNTYPPTTAAGQEYWARIDRQKMARDIYVLLYLTSHGDDTMNTATTSNQANGANPAFSVYTEAQLREMAQFAVNLVDSMDRDSVITRFEYDKDLSDGWNLDDDPYATIEVFGTAPNTSTPYTYSNANYNPSYPNDSSVRGEVYGIERLDLTISESLVIKAAQSSTMMDYPMTNYNEAASNRFFFYVELRNHGPLPITFDAKEAWQIVLRQDIATAPGYWERSLSLKAGANPINPTADSVNPATVTGTDLPYVIGTTDSSIASTGYNRSTFAADISGGSSPKRLIPNRPSTSPATLAECDLDLIETASPTTVFRIRDENHNDVTGTAGAMLSAFTGASPTANLTAGATIKVMLRRRVNPTRTLVAPYDNDQDNPFVEVDSMMLKVGTPVTSPGSGFMTFTLSGMTPNGAMVSGQVNSLISQERPEPLAGGPYESPNTGTPNGLITASNPQTAAMPATVYNSFGGPNQNTVPGPFTVWQLQFDRSYASLMDLLYVPVFGPHQLTSLAKQASIEPPDTQVDGTHDVTNKNWTVGPAGSGAPYTISAKSAAAKFVVPENHTNIGSTTPNHSLDNRWHRLLEFLEVPTRTNINLGVGTALTIPRVPGKMNLNTMRYSENLAALLDDARLVNLDLTPATGTIDFEAPTLDDNTGESPANVGAAIARDWWYQFLLSRDPLDPLSATNLSVNLPLPGLPSSTFVTLPPGGTYATPPDARPFRNIADVGYTVSAPSSASPGIKHPSVADTILRALPLDSSPLMAPPPTTLRRLLEVGNSTEHQNGSVDPYIRHRLLSKIYGNSTTRSNCFAVFISVKYFQAVELNGAVQIGGPLSGKYEPEHRGFFVVDRSKLENGQTSSGPTYNFRAFIDYRKTLQTQ